MRPNSICPVVFAVVLASGAFPALALCQDPTEEPGRIRVRGVEMTDTRTGLVWLRCPAGYVAPSGGCDSARVLPSESWDSAMAGPVRTPQLPPGEWRLASVEELETIAAKGCGYLINDKYIELMFGKVWTRSAADNGMVWQLEATGRVKAPKKGPASGGDTLAQTVYVRNADAVGRQVPAAARDGRPDSGAPLEVLIGHVAPLSGNIAHLGKDNENGARLAIEEANAANIRIGGRPATFRLVEIDDQADPQTGVRAAQKLVAVGVAGVVGHLSSGVSIPASDIYGKANIPMVSGSATNPFLTERGLRNVFRVIGRDDRQGTAISRVLLASALKRNAKPKIAIIDDSTAYGESMANSVEGDLRSLGMAILPRQKGTSSTTDWTAVLRNVRDGNADVVFYGGMDDTAAPLLKQARASGITALFAFPDGVCFDGMGQLAGPAAEGFLCSQMGVPMSAVTATFREAYRNRFGTAAIMYSPYTYDAARVLIEAMKKANSADPARFMPELAEVDYSGATGRIAFDAKGDRRDAEVTIYTMTGGKLVPTAIVGGSLQIQWLRR